MTLKNNIEVLRKGRGLTVHDLCYLVWWLSQSLSLEKVIISKKKMNAYIKGTRYPTQKEKVLIALALGESVNRVFHKTDKPPIDLIAQALERQTKERIDLVHNLYGISQGKLRKKVRKDIDKAMSP